MPMITLNELVNVLERQAGIEFVFIVVAAAFTVGVEAHGAFIVVIRMMSVPVGAARARHRTRAEGVVLVGVVMRAGHCFGGIDGSPKLPHFSYLCYGRMWFLVEGSRKDMIAGRTR